jgi:hypothetical protein
VGRNGAAWIPFRLGRLLLMGLILGLGPGCALVGTGPAPTPAPPMLSGPPIRDGIRSDDEARAAAVLVTEGEDMLAQGFPAIARERAREVEARYPEAMGSSAALWLRARASRELEDWVDAEGAAASYLALVPSGELAFDEAALLRAEARWEAGLDGAVSALFDIPQGASPSVLESAEVLAAEWAGRMDTFMLRETATQAPRHPRILPPFLVELAVRRWLSGDEAEGREFADEALALQPTEEVATRARAVLDGRIAELAVSATLGSVLSGEGSPSVRQVAAEIQDGIEVALLVEDGAAFYPVRFVPMQDGGDASSATQAVESLGREGVAGVIGPLLDSQVDAVARAGSRSFPILSPTARILPEGIPGVFSLTGVDPAAGRALASAVLGEGVREVVVIHPNSPEMQEEARWFREAYEGSGGRINRTLTYPMNATGLASQLQEVVRLAPRGLVLLLPQGHVELVAPQIAFYGLDQRDDLILFGNETWVSQPVLEGMLPRHTDGVRSISSRVQGSEFGPGWNQFVSAYEGHFRRTLRSPMAALGYDAARLLLLAARNGGGTPEGTLRALEEVRDFPGATGVLSVVDGRIQRSYTPVRIQNRQLIPLSQGSP